MPVPVVCKCSAKLKVGDDLRGKHVRCPRCGAVLPVAAPASAASLDDQERERLEAELRSGERLLWADKPDAAAGAARSWLFAVRFFAGGFFSLLVCVVLLAGGLAGDVVGLAVAGLFGVPGLGMLVFGALYPSRARRCYERTAYAVTDRRALAWDCDLFGNVGLRAYQPAELVRLRKLVVKPDGDLGNLVFGTRVVRRKTAHGTIRVGVRSYGFFYVRGATEVERLLREHLIEPFTDQLYEK